MTSVASYPLSPMQQGMLFHSLLPRDREVYVHHVVCVLYEPMDAAALHQAWEQVVARHPILRTSLHWHGVDEPHQAVQEQVAVPLATGGVLFSEGKLPQGSPQNQRDSQS